MEQSTYLQPLDRLKSVASRIPNTPLLARAKIDALILMNMRYESIHFNSKLEQHPYGLTATLIEDAIQYLSQWSEVHAIEDSNNNQPFSGKSSVLEAKHQDLFQDLWVKFSPEEYNERIERYVHRLKINGLFDGFLKNMRCIDFGCGHGNFAHALVRAGASYALGIDYGEKSIGYATRAAARLGESRVEFKLASVYEVPVPDGSFDFALQNGVFHHLQDEDRAIAEMQRVLKPGGWIWYYTDGAGGISNYLWDATVEMLKDIPHSIILDHLASLNLTVGKRYHLGDGLNATYRHTTWEEITERLGRLGFDSFKRLAGGFPTDFDQDAVTQHRFGKEKFGSGELRLLARKR